MKYFTLLSILFISLSVYCQTDTSVIIDKVEKNNFQHIFSEQSINNLPKEILITEQKITNSFKQYFFLFLLNLLSISIFLMNFSKAKLKKVMSTLSSINILKQLSQTESKRSNSYLYAYFLLFFIFLLSFIYALNIVYNLNLDLLLIAIALMFFFILDALINYVTSYLLKANDLLQTIFFNNISILICSIPLIFLATMLSVYLSFKLVYITSIALATVLVAVYIYKEIRNIFILKAYKIKIGSFYFFLYLCTFKILPMVILLKYLSRNL